MMQSKIYHVSYSAVLQEIGEYPQAGFIYHQNADSDEIKYSVDLTKVIRGINLRARAKGTDFLNLVDCGEHESLVCSEDAQKAIEKLNLPPVKSLKVEASNKKGIYKGYWVNVFDFQFYDFIDFGRSSFIAKGVLDNDVFLKAENRLDFEDKYISVKRQGLFVVLPDMVFLKKELIEKCDLFSFPRYGTELYATSNFHQLYTDLNLSGLQFQEIESFEFI